VIDPERQLSIVLLTNRTWPDCQNQAIKEVPPSVLRRGGLSIGEERLKREELKRKRMAPELRRLGTEKNKLRLGRSRSRSALEIARIINAEDAKVAAAVKGALRQIAQAIDLIAAALSRGGRLIYVGTGTSGRIAALDAVECPPTFDVDRAWSNS